jgi:L-threonylcarbamoyladenylate synthase
MPEMLDWPQGEPNEVVSRALSHLRAGRLVVLPTESIYMVVASALAPGALDAIDRAVGPNTPATILLGQAIEVFDWLPAFRSVGIRLARSFWPGPLTLVSGSGTMRGLLPYLSRPVQERLAPSGQFSLRLPYHEAARQVAQRLGTPLLAVPTEWISADQVKASLGEKDVLIVNDGRTSFAQADTVVEVNGRNWSLRQEGAIPAEDITEAAPCRIVFVCTGNTCRSPMAEGICRKLLAERLRCSRDELGEHGFIVQSAGVAAGPGNPATAEAVDAIREIGADISAHRSQPLTIELMVQADRLFAMTAGHLRMLYGVRGVTPALLSPFGDDVDDPIGGSAEQYRDCARQIKTYLEALLPELCEC